MLFWAFLAMMVGILNLVASIFYPMDPVFLKVNGYIYLLVGAGLVLRRRLKQKEGHMEELEARVHALEAHAQGQSQPSVSGT